LRINGGEVPALRVSSSTALWLEHYLSPASTPNDVGLREGPLIAATALLLP
jgi:hypothetical protein